MFERASSAYGWPKFGHAAEMRSLAYHAGLRRGVRDDGPVGSARALIVANTIEVFAAAKWAIPADFMQFSHFKRVVMGLDWNSSPGYPYMRRAPTNRDYFKVVEGIPDETVLLHVWDVVNDRLRVGDADPIRLFIKPEPHKVAKIQDGRYRLISSVSVIDQIIDHMLFGPMNEALVAGWPYVPSKIGWSPYSGGWRAMPVRGNWMALDKASWDWTVHMWLLELVLEVRMGLCENMNERWLDLAIWRYRRLFLDPELITSGGCVFRQRNPGVMKSGCVNTIADNSIGQVLLHNRVCMEVDITPGGIFCMGDDTLQETPDRMPEYLAKTGLYCKVKEPVFATEFAGMRFLDRRVEPVYRGKHAFTLLHVDPEILPQLANSYALLYHRSVYGGLIKRVLEEMGQTLPKSGVLDAIFDGY